MARKVLLDEIDSLKERLELAKSRILEIKGEHINQYAPYFELVSEHIIRCIELYEDKDGLAELEGYEIHMGDTRGAAAGFCCLEDGTEDGAAGEGVFGTYLHGLFDSGELTARLAAWLAGRKGIKVPDVQPEPRAAYRNRQYDRLADAVESSLDMEAIRRAMEEYAHENTAR